MNVFPKPFRSWTPLIDPRSIPRGPVLVCAPHPDDEVIGCGGAVAMHVARGDAVHVVHLTGGEAGDPASQFAPDAAALVALRMREAKAAAAVLGVTELTGLGFPDGKLEAGEAAVARLAEVVARVAPAVVYAPSPLECHSDHLATCAVAGMAIARANATPRLFLFEVNHPTIASFLLDVTPWIETKRKALEQFASQQRYNDLVGKFLALAYAHTVNIALPGVEYCEAFLEVAPARLPELWDDLAALHQKFGLP